MTPIIIISAILVLTLLHMWLERRPGQESRRARETELSRDSGAALTAPMIIPTGTSFETQIEEEPESEPNWKDEPDFKVEMASPPEPRLRPATEPEPVVDGLEQLTRREEVEQFQEIKPEPQAESEFKVLRAPQPEPEPQTQPDLEVEIAQEPQPQTEPQFELKTESRPFQPESPPDPQPESEREAEAEPEPQPEFDTEPKLESDPQPIATPPQPTPDAQTTSEAESQDEPLADQDDIEAPQLALAAPAPTTDFTGPRLISNAGSDPSHPLDEVVSGLEKIPPLPQSAHQILSELGSAVSSAHLVGDILASDSTIGAALVRVVNSAALGVAHRILTVHEAVSHLGFSTVRGIILRLKLAGLLPPPRARRHCYDTAELWVHSTAVSAVADALARRVNQDAQLDIDPALASTLGLLHDVGRLAINSQFPTRVAELRPQKKARNAAKTADAADYENLLARERRIFGADHAFIGGLLAARWQLPGDLADGIRMHHLPAGETLDNLPPPLYRALVLVHIANQLVKLKHAYCHDMPFDVIPESMFTALNLPPSLEDLLDQSVCTAIAHATAISHELSALPRPRKRLSA